MTARGARPQDEIDTKNAAFWDELCGSRLAEQLGITDNSPASLKKFDDWYLDYYPYLADHIPFADLRAKRVLEVGLGYGTVAQKIAQSGAHYHGLDIAAGPVAMAAHRCELVGAQNPVVKQGSILTPPFDDGTFDWVIAIGCLHHTGNLPEAIKVVHRLLKPGGEAIIMVYSASSYRQFTSEPVTTLKRRFQGAHNTYNPPQSKEQSRGAYDVNVDGTAAPQTEFVTKSELKLLCRDFSKVDIKAENIGAEGVFRLIPRPTLCKWLGPSIGLDLYCHMVK